MENKNDPSKILITLLASDDKICSETKKHYNCFVTQFINFNPKQDISEYVTRDIRRWMAYLLDQGQKDSTRASKLAALKWYFTFAAEENYIIKNPSFSIKFPKIEEQLPKALDAQSKFKLREAAKQNLRDSTIIETLFDTGLRTSELIFLKRENIDTKHFNIWVENGKGLKERYVYFNDYCANLLETYMKTHQNEYVFVTRLNKPFSRQGLWNLVKKYVAKAGLDIKVTTHFLRHTLLTELSERGMELAVTQKIAGHKNPKTTRIYSKTSLKVQKIQYDMYN